MENPAPVTTDTTALPQNGHSQSVVLSSNTTLFWRVFVPVFGTVFFGGLTLAFWLIPAEDLYLSFSALWARLALTALWLGWLWGVYRTIWRLKRVDADDTHFFVTNYWTTVRYPWQDVAQIEEQKRAGRRIVHFWLKSPGRFGPKISFLPGTYFDEWWRERGKPAPNSPQ
jgi:hypothetical protein